ncbi:hypothetical protein SDC9_168645 [bioreactor metagenome]|uniref:Uncharacterized protein n=1 Tax=bioreactor metagenome TaxID=1076179 RepID=A0A645G564_9ZZZZ
MILGLPNETELRERIINYLNEKEIIVEEVR